MLKTKEPQTKRYYMREILNLLFSILNFHTNIYSAILPTYLIFTARLTEEGAFDCFE